MGDSSTENRGSVEPYICITSIMGVPPSLCCRWISHELWSCACKRKEHMSWYQYLFCTWIWKISTIKIPDKIIAFHSCCSRGRIFLKEGALKLRTDRTLAPVGTGDVWGGCAPSEAEKICNFQSQFARFGAFSLPGAPSVRCPISAKNRGGAWQGAPPF